MAARRLVIVMLVLLAISTLAAALLPPPDRDATTTTAPQKRLQPPAVAAPSPSAAGLLLVAQMRIGGRAAKTVRVEHGDELRLDVSAGYGDDVEISGYGRTAAVTAFAPAQFDLLATRAGAFPVRAVSTGQVAGMLLVGRPGSGRCGVAKPQAPAGPRSARACSRRGRPAR